MPPFTHYLRCANDRWPCEADVRVSILARMRTAGPGRPVPDTVGSDRLKSDAHFSVRLLRLFAGGSSRSENPKVPDFPHGRRPAQDVFCDVLGQECARDVASNSVYEP